MVAPLGPTFYAFTWVTPSKNLPWRIPILFPTGALVDPRQEHSLEAFTVAGFDYFEKKAMLRSFTKR